MTSTAIPPGNGQGPPIAPPFQQPPMHGPGPPDVPPPVNRGRWYRRGWVIALAALLVGIGLGAASGSGSTKTNPTTVTTPGQTVVKTAPGSTKTTIVHKVSRPTKTVTVTKTVTAPSTSAAGNSGNTGSASTLTTSQQNAVTAAKDYLSTSGFSKQGLIVQLSSSAGDGYSVSDATVAVDSLTVNWDAEAVQDAKQYLQGQSFSCQGLIQQLSSSAGDQFTEAQAQYGAAKVGLC